MDEPKVVLREGERYVEILSPYSFIDGYGESKTHNYYCVECFTDNGYALVSERQYSTKDAAESAALEFLIGAKEL